MDGRDWQPKYCYIPSGNHHCTPPGLHGMNVTTSLKVYLHPMMLFYPESQSALPKNTF